ncbi:MAG: hypothetical protein AAF696_36845, partial [Bacteroidota bacterium]
MKNAIVFLSIFFFLSFPLVKAQSIDTTFQKRSFRQQLFGIHYIQEHKPAQVFSSSSEIDAYYKDFIASWKASLTDEDPLMYNLDPYAAILLLKMSMGPEIEKARWAKCHVYSRYMIPSFIKDFDHYSQDINIRNSYLIYWPAIDWMINPLFCYCELAVQKWEEFHQRLGQLPELMNRYLREATYGDENQKKSLEKTLRASLKNKRLFSIRN